MPTTRSHALCRREDCGRRYDDHSTSGACPDGQGTFSKRFQNLRVGNSFSRDEILAGDALFKALLQGKDVRVLLRSDGCRSLMQKFQSMRVLSASQESAPKGAAPSTSPSVGAANTHPNGADLSNSQLGG